MDTTVEPLVLRIRRAIESEIGVPVLVTQDQDSFLVTLVWGEEEKREGEGHGAIVTSPADGE